MGLLDKAKDLAEMKDKAKDLLEEHGDKLPDGLKDKAETATNLLDKLPGQG